MSEKTKELHQRLFEVGKKIGLPTNYIVSWEPILYNRQLLMVLKTLSRGNCTKEDIQEYLHIVETLAVNSKKCLENLIGILDLEIPKK